MQSDFFSVCTVYDVHTVNIVWLMDELNGFFRVWFTVAVTVELRSLVILLVELLPSTVLYHQQSAVVVYMLNRSREYKRLQLFTVIFFRQYQYMESDGSLSFSFANTHTVLTTIFQVNLD